MTHAYTRTDANGDVHSIDFPEVGELGSATAEDVERLAIMQALYNAIAQEVSTTKAGNLRDRVNRRYLDLYDQTGATGFEVRLRGKKVGTYGFPKTGERPARVVQRPEVVDAAALAACEDDDFNDFISRWVASNLDGLAARYFDETGVLVDGMALVEVEEPAKPAGIKTKGTMRVHPDKVAEALQGELPTVVAGLLGGGE